MGPRGRTASRSSRSYDLRGAVTGRRGAGEPQKSHGCRELHGAAEPGAAGGGERDAGRARAQRRRRPCGGGGAQRSGGPGHRCRGPRHQGKGAPGHLPRGRGWGVVPLISACENFPARPAHLQTREHAPLFLAFQGLMRRGGTRAAASAAGLHLCRGSPGAATAPSAVVKSAPRPPHCSGGSDPARDAGAAWGSSGVGWEVTHPQRVLRPTPAPLSPRFGKSAVGPGPVSQRGEAATRGFSAYGLWHRLCLERPGFGTQSCCGSGSSRHRLPDAEKAWGVARSEPKKTWVGAALPKAMTGFVNKAASSVSLSSLPVDSCQEINITGGNS